MPRISLDIDGVLSDFGGGVKAVAKDLWPGRIQSNYEPPNWDWTDILTKEDWNLLWKNIKAKPNFWYGLAPYEENVAALRRFLRDESGYEIYYVTSRAKTAGELIAVQTRDWFAAYGLDTQFNYQAIIPVPKPELKMPIMSALGIESHIDDYGPTITQCNELPNHKAFVLDRSWNRDKDYGPRVFSLEEYFNRITSNV